MAPELLLAWWNLIYIVPFALALIYLGLFVFTGITFGQPDADIDADADVHFAPDADSTVQVEAHVVDHDVSADHDASVEHDAEHDVHASHEASGRATTSMLAHSVDAPAGHDAPSHASPLLNFLSMLGIGKIPLSLALMILLLFWGVIGFTLNNLVALWITPSALIGLLTIPIAAVICLALTGLGASILSKILPVNETSNERRQDLVGKAGEAVFDIDATFGMANVCSSTGGLFQVPCRTEIGKPIIRKGARVILFDYDREKEIFRVAPFDA